MGQRASKPLKQAKDNDLGPSFWNMFLIFTYHVISFTSHIVNRILSIISYLHCHMSYIIIYIDSISCHTLSSIF